MRQSVWFCATVATALGVMVVATEHVEPREVRSHRRDAVFSLFPEDSLTRARNRRLSSETRGQQWARRNIYSRHYSQEEPDKSAAYWANQRLPRNRHHSSGGRGDTRNLHTMAPARSESRPLQPVRIDGTGSPVVRDSARDRSPTSRTMAIEDERFSSRVHQVGRHTSTNDRRRLPYARYFYEAMRPPTSRDRLQGPPPQQNAEIYNRVSHDDTWATHTSLIAGRGEQAHSSSMASSSTPAERVVHHQHRTPNTNSRLEFTRDPSIGITRDLAREPDGAGERLQTHGFSEISDEVENDVQQRVDQSKWCCGSSVPFDPRFARPTGAFQRVASAGSIKVVNVPVEGSYPPSEVRDLRAVSYDPHTLYLTWTTPGEDLDSGTASGYIIRLSESRHDLQESQFDVAPEETLLETSAVLRDAGVYQTAGTRVGVEVPLVRPLQGGRVYYVAFKALDSDGYSSGVSNMAMFTIPESSANNARVDPQVEEAQGTTTSRGSLRRSGEVAVPSERNPEPPPTRGSYTASEPQAEPNSGRNSEEQSLLSTPPTSISDRSESEGSENQRKRRKNRKNKNKKSKRRRKSGRRSGRRDGRQREEDSDTSVWNSHALDIYAELERWNES